MADTATYVLRVEDNVTEENRMRSHSIEKCVKSTDEARPNEPLIFIIPCKYEGIAGIEDGGCLRANSTTCWEECDWDRVFCFDVCLRNAASGVLMEIYAYRTGICVEKAVYLVAELCGEH